MFNEMVKYDSRSTLSRNIFEFYRNYETFLSKNKNLINKFEKDIIDPVATFTKHITGKYQETLNELKTVKIFFNLVDKFYI
jgi:hypothetical protein